MNVQTPAYELQKEKKQFPEKRYRFRFSALTLALLAAALALCAAGIALTTWLFVEFLQGGDLSSAFDWLKFIVFYIVSIGIAVVVTAMLIRSEYILTEKNLTLALGLIRMKTPLEQISSVHLFKGANKLAVYFDGAKTRYMVIVVNAALYEEFARELILRNERIGFSFSAEGKEADNKRKKWRSAHPEKGPPGGNTRGRRFALFRRRLSPSGSRSLRSRACGGRAARAAALRTGVCSRSR